MKTKLLTLVLTTFSFIAFSQNYEIGDVLYYKNNKLVQRRTDVKVVIKNNVVAKDHVSTKYVVDKYVINDNNEFVLESEFVSIGLAELKADGFFISYHPNGNKASEGHAVNGRIGDGVWTYYYKDGEKRSEEKITNVSYFSEKTKNAMLNFWTEEGEQTVTNGDGVVEITNSEGVTEKGAYKNKFKTGMWTGFAGETKKYEETYKKGNLVKGTSFNSNDESFSYKKIKEPAYYIKKDNSAVKKYVYGELSTKLTSIEGQMIVDFIVTKDGTVKNVDIVKGLTRNYEKEVKRILATMKWTPAMERGQPHDSHYLLKLRFNK